MALQEQLGRLREAGPRAVNFLGEVWAEMKKVHWPTRKETYAATVVVLVVTVLVAVVSRRRRFRRLAPVQAILS